MDAILLQILNGLDKGGAYALIALGFSVVHNTMGIVNFVQVDFVSLGGMLMFSALFTLGLPMVPGLLLAVAGVALAAMLGDQAYEARKHRRASAALAEADAHDEIEGVDPEMPWWRPAEPAVATRSSMAPAGMV